jgi:Ala-tRNA(Pro) deacylase
MHGHIALPSLPLVQSEGELLAFLDQQGIVYLRVEHPAVYTLASRLTATARRCLPSARKIYSCATGIPIIYLLTTYCKKPVDLKALGKGIGVTKLHFGSEDKLLEILGVTPGAVTLLGLVNDIQHQVQLLVDSELWEEEHYLCHPLVNTATLLLARSDLLRFFELDRARSTGSRSPGSTMTS